MMENNKIDNTRIIEDGDLNNVSGGLSAQDYEKAANDIAATLKGVGVILEKFGDLLQIIKTSLDTNTCPLCNQKIVPLAEQCELNDFLQHVKTTHKDQQ